MSTAELRHGSFSREFAERKRWKLDQGLFNALLGILPQKTLVLEMGAGIGRYVTELRKAGYEAHGIDGIEGIEQLSKGIVQQVDLTEKGASRQVLLSIGRPAWGLCIEVGEHIPKERLSQFLDNICYIPANGLIISWGTPGQRGHDHVSCRLPEWVTIEVVKRGWKELGWKLDHDATVEARRIAGKGWNRKLLVFRR